MKERLVGECEHNTLCTSMKQSKIKLNQIIFTPGLKHFAQGQPEFCSPEFRCKGLTYNNNRSEIRNNPNGKRTTASWIISAEPNVYFFTEQIRSFPDGLSEVFFFPRLLAENKLEVYRKGHPHLSKKHIFIIKRGKVQPHTKSSSLNTSRTCVSQVVL